MELHHKTTYKRSIRGKSEIERRKAFNTINYVPFRRVHANKRGKKNNNLNKCLQLLEVRAWERGGDCSFKNNDLALALRVTSRQVTTYIKQLELQGFISVLYYDDIKQTPVVQLDPLTNEHIVNKDGTKVILKTNKKRLTYRIIRCHRIIAKNGYRPPAAKVDPNCRKNKPFRFDFRPPTELINFDNIPLEIFEYSRIKNVFVRQNNVLNAIGKREKQRYDAMKKCFNSGIGIEDGIAQGIIPPPLNDNEMSIPNPFHNLIEQYASENSDDHPIIYDFEVHEIYHRIKNLAMMGEKEGTDILGEQYFTNPDLDVLPDHKVMYFKKQEQSKSDHSNSEWVSRDYIEKLRNQSKNYDTINLEY